MCFAYKYIYFVCSCKSIPAESSVSLKVNWNVYDKSIKSYATAIKIKSISLGANGCVGFYYSKVQEIMQL